METTKPIIGLATVILILNPAGAAAQSDVPVYKSSGMQYLLHSGGLGDVAQPSQSDTKLHILLSGKTAKDLFNHLRKDKYDACTAGMGIRVRATPGDGLVCLRHADGKYTCGIGVDMKTGKLSLGIIC
jgi:hypothetical protein